MEQRVKYDLFCNFSKCDELAIIYCESCASLLCQRCKRGKHLKNAEHKIYEISKLPLEVFESLARQQIQEEIDEYSDTLRTFDRQIGTIIHELAQETQELRTGTIACSAIKDHFDTIRATLSTREGALLNEIEAMSINKVTLLERQRSYIAEIIATAHSTISRKRSFSYDDLFGRGLRRMGVADISGHALSEVLQLSSASITDQMPLEDLLNVRKALEDATVRNRDPVDTSEFPLHFETVGLVEIVKSYGVVGGPPAPTSLICTLYPDSGLVRITWQHVYCQEYFMAMASSVFIDTSQLLFVVECGVVGHSKPGASSTARAGMLDKDNPPVAEMMMMTNETFQSAVAAVVAVDDNMDGVGGEVHDAAELGPDGTWTEVGNEEQQAASDQIKMQGTQKKFMRRRSSMRSMGGLAPHQREVDPSKPVAGELVFFEVTRVWADEGRAAMAAWEDDGEEAQDLIACTFDVRPYISSHVSFRVKALLCDKAATAVNLMSGNMESVSEVGAGVAGVSGGSAVGVSEIGKSGTVIEPEIDGKLAERSEVGKPSKYSMTDFTSSKWTTLPELMKIPSRFLLVKEFPFISTFDTNGFLYNIATDGGTKPYVNPHESGLVVAAMSSCGFDYCSPHKFVAHVNEGPNITLSESDAWMSVDLGPKRWLLLNYYCLRHGKSDSTHMLRNWELQASEAGDVWVTLRRHEADESMPARAFSTSFWPITGAGLTSDLAIRMLQKEQKAAAVAAFTAAMASEDTTVGNLVTPTGGSSSSSMVMASSRRKGLHNTVLAALKKSVKFEDGGSVVDGSDAGAGGDDPFRNWEEKSQGSECSDMPPLGLPMRSVPLKGRSVIVRPCDYAQVLAVSTRAPVDSDVGTICERGVAHNAATKSGDDVSGYGDLRQPLVEEPPVSATVNSQSPHDNCEIKQDLKSSDGDSVRRDDVGPVVNISSGSGSPSPSWRRRNSSISVIIENFENKSSRAISSHRDTDTGSAKDEMMGAKDQINVEKKEGQEEEKPEEGIHSAATEANSTIIRVESRPDEQQGAAQAAVADCVPFVNMAGVWLFCDSDSDDDEAEKHNETLGQSNTPTRFTAEDELTFSEGDVDFRLQSLTPLSRLMRMDSDIASQFFPFTRPSQLEDDNCESCVDGDSSSSSSVTRRQRPQSGDASILTENPPYSSGRRASIADMLRSHQGLVTAGSHDDDDDTVTSTEPEPFRGYRYFRILHRKGYFSSSQLACSGIELYGRLTEEIS